MTFPISRKTVYAPVSEADLTAIVKKCRGIVTRRALLSAGVAAVPLPGLDVLTDIGLLVRVINAINQEFGLTPEQMAQLEPEKKILAFEGIVGMSALLIGKVVTHRLIVQLLKRSGIKILSRQSAKIVPIAGQLVSAAIGYAAFRKIGNEHIDACARIAGTILRPA